MGGDDVTRFLAVLSTLLEMLGLATVVAAGWLVDFRLGLAVLGLVLVLFGFVLDRPEGGRR